MPSKLTDVRHAYDLAAESYAKEFVDELREKPSDVTLLNRFASTVGHGRRVLDLGCGPGHTTAFLTSLGLTACGVDLSRGMIEQAKSLFPDVAFAEGNFFELNEPRESIAGILAFYCIVHLTQNELAPAFSEMFRVLEPGGVLLLSFHVGDEPIHVESFLDTGASLDFSLFSTEAVRQGLLAAEFSDIEITSRSPYKTEHPTQRCYTWARKPVSERGDSMPSSAAIG